MMASVINAESPITRALSVPSASPLITSRSGPYAISLAAQCLDQGPVAGTVDLLAQARNVDVDHIGLRFELVAPDMGEQHGAGHRPSGVAHHVFENGEFARVQVDVASAVV